MNVPHACRPLVTVYKAVAKVTSTDAYLDMSEAEFVGSCMYACGGSADPKRFVQVYYDLMKEAGVHTERSPMKSFEDNGDHSWEYYIEGKLVKEDAYTTAHTSYYAA